MFNFKKQGTNQLIGILIILCYYCLVKGNSVSNKDLCLGFHS